MDLENLKNQINTKPNPWTEDRTKVWFIDETQREILNELIDELEAWREGRIEIEELDQSTILLYMVK